MDALQPKPSLLEENKALLKLQREDSALRNLEAAINQFKIFDAVGMGHQEIRHSAFLAYLLTPSKPHGLGDRFLKEFLRIANVEDAELVTGDLTATRVEREWRNIDILAVNSRHMFVLLIENKIYSGEHSDQLARYLETVKHHYPDYRIVGVYLTLGADKPSHTAFIELGHSDVAEAVCRVRQQQPVPSDSVALVLDHYERLLRRYTVEDVEVERLCMQIYTQHKQAIDAINSYLPNQQARVRRHLVELISCAAELEPTDPPTKRWLGFYCKSWDELVPRIEPE